MKITIRFLIGFIAVLTMTLATDGRTPSKKKSSQQPPPMPATTPGPSSAAISRFLSAHLDRILGPLDQKIDLPRSELGQLRESFAKQFSKASLAERPKFQLGLAVCDAIADAMNERNKAVLTQAGATWPQQSAQLRQKIDQLASQQRAAEGN
jgi:hypothetical protein